MPEAKPSAGTPGTSSLERMADLTRRVVAVPKDEVPKPKPKKRRRH
jgi:hypothetical protein